LAPHDDAPAVQQPQPASTYTVVSGDELLKVARRALSPQASFREVWDYADAIYERNKHVIGDDWDWIFPDQVLELP
ncbi:LysM peptidoglycan-binding domain-containing protein, partial [Candidatus Parcubacteria bacterium]|nr:LysM peptidoglycan-binding domain-containing protein [Candidatus Parcubacteria bacterium]